MTPRFPKNEALRLEALMYSLFRSFGKLPRKENLPSEMVLSAISNAAAMFATNHGIDAKCYVELQAAMILDQTERKGVKK
jgi:hypothetical protein